jgi:hypothetical protein
MEAKDVQEEISDQD